MTSANSRQADHPIDPLFLERWSPRAFTGEVISESDLFTMLEAGRWAASSYNSQPWRFLYARRDTPNWERFLGLLNDFNRSWAKNASALVVLVSNSLMRPPGAEKDVPSHSHSLDAGAAKRSPELGPLQISAGGMLAIGEGPDTKALLDFLRPMYALYVGGMGARGKNFYNTLFSRYGYEAEAKEIQDLYLDGKKKEAEAAVPLELLERAHLVGPESWVKERLAAFEEAGVTNLQIVAATDDPPALVRQLKGMVS